MRIDALSQQGEIIYVLEADSLDVADPVDADLQAPVTLSHRVSLAKGKPVVESSMRVNLGALDQFALTWIRARDLGEVV